MKRALVLAVVSLALAAGLAATVSPISPAAVLEDLTARPIKEGPTGPAPRSTVRAKKVLVADARMLASNFAHKRYRSVCFDLTAKQRHQSGGTRGCMLRVELLNSFLSIKRITLTKVAMSRSRIRARVSIRINGSNKHGLTGVFKWEAGMYRLDQETGA